MPSIIDLVLHKNEWSLTSADTELVIQGQFVPTDLSEGLSAKYASEDTVGREVPLRQYLSGSGSNMRFRAKCWAHSQGAIPGFPGGGSGPFAQNIEDIVSAIKSTVRINPDIGRPEIFTFQVGTSVELPLCVVQSVGRIRYDRLRPLDGSLRGVTFDIVLLEYVEYNTSISASVAESLIIPAREGESFEHIAQRAYGDADAGEALRRRNPETTPLSVGTLVHAPPKARLLRGFEKTPQSVALRKTDAAAAMRRDRFSARDRDFYLTTVNW